MTGRARGLEESASALHCGSVARAIDFAPTTARRLVMSRNIASRRALRGLRVTLPAAQKCQHRFSRTSPLCARERTCGPHPPRHARHVFLSAGLVWAPGMSSIRTECVHVMSPLDRQTLARSTPNCHFPEPTSLFARRDDAFAIPSWSPTTTRARTREASRNAARGCKCAVVFGPRYITHEVAERSGVASSNISGVSFMRLSISQPRLKMVRSM